MPDPRTGRATQDDASESGTVAGAPNPAAGGGHSTTESSQAQREGAAQGRTAEQTDKELTPEQKEAYRHFRESYEASLGRRLTELERERIELLGPEAVGFRGGRSPLTAQTVAGPVDHVDPKMSDKDMWKRQEQAYLTHNQSEVERAATEAEQAGLDGLVCVKSGLTGESANRVAFTEDNPLHPHSYAYVAGQDSPPVIVALTSEVRRALLSGQIVEVEAEVPEAVKKFVTNGPTRGRRR